VVSENFDGCECCRLSAFYPLCFHVVPWHAREDTHVVRVDALAPKIWWTDGSRWMGRSVWLATLERRAIGPPVRVDCFRQTKIISITLVEIPLGRSSFGSHLGEVKTCRLVDR
jgi:hypothetical protein